MPHNPACHAERFVGSFPRSSAEVALWAGGRATEDILDPLQPIFDPHHHVYCSPVARNFYTIDDLVRDLATGHRIVGTAYVEAYCEGWRTEGAEEFRTVGEVEKILALSPAPIALPTGDCQVAAAVIAFADVMLGDRVDAVLDVLQEAGKDRLRGIRYRTAVTGGLVGRTIAAPPARHLLLDAMFQQGVARLGMRGLSFDVWAYDEQIAEVSALADACSDVCLVVDHLGGPIGVLDAGDDLGERRRQWIADLRSLALRPNVKIKVGGMGMTMFGFGFEHAPQPPGSKELAAAWRDNFEICLEVFGAERCMFESNFPVDGQSAGYATVWNAFKRLAHRLSGAEKRALFYGTAARAYGLDVITAVCDQAMGGYKV